MANYIDGFTLPIPKNYLEDYKQVAQKVAEIWKEHGALAYHEFLGEDLSLEGTRSFTEAVDAQPDEVIIFGSVLFDSKKSRDLINIKVASDPRMETLISPLTNSKNPIFDAKRMVYGGFQSFI